MAVIINGVNFTQLLDNILQKDNIIEYTPSQPYHPATKKYVDDIISGGSISVNVNWSDIANKPSSTVSAIDLAVTNSHTHTNKSILDATTASYTTTEQTKLSGLVNYVHPDYHPATMISEDALHRFTTDAEKTVWDSKEPAFSKNTAFNKNFGNTTGTVCEGNDTRLSDNRNPLAHNQTISTITNLQTTLDGKASASDLTTLSGTVATMQTTLDGKANASDVLTKTNTTAFTPTADYHPATKKFVLDSMTSAGAGDMMKSVYDTDNDGIVDNAEKLGGQLPAYYLSATDGMAKSVYDTDNDGIVDNAEKLGGQLPSYYLSTVGGIIAGTRFGARGQLLVKGVSDHSYFQVQTDTPLTKEVGIQFAGKDASPDIPNWSIYMPANTYDIVTEGVTGIYGSIINKATTLIHANGTFVLPSTPTLGLGKRSDGARSTLGMWYSATVGFHVDVDSAGKVDMLTYQNPGWVTALSINKTGNISMATGLTVGGTSAASPTIAIDGNSQPSFSLRNNGTLRFGIFTIDGAGTAMHVGRYNDSGAYLDSPIIVNRSTGLVTINGMCSTARLNATLLQDSNRASGIYTNVGDGILNPDGSVFRSNYWHIFQSHWTDNNGYGCQIAVPLSPINESMYWRSSNGYTFGAWHKIYDDSNLPVAGIVKLAEILITNNTTTSISISFPTGYKYYKVLYNLNAQYYGDLYMTVDNRSDAIYKQAASGSPTTYLTFSEGTNSSQYTYGISVLGEMLINRDPITGFLEGMLSYFDAYRYSWYSRLFNTTSAVTLGSIQFWNPVSYYFPSGSRVIVYGYN